MKALYILNVDAFERIYGQPERDEIAQLVDLVAPPQTAASIAEKPELLSDVEIILSGWGAPKMDAALLEAAPNLRAVFYGAGTVRYFVTDAFWARDITLMSAWGANAVPVSEYALSAILLSLKRFWHFAIARRELDKYTHKPADGKTVHGGFDSTVGLISLGMIGRLMVERLRPFDLNIIAYDPYVTSVDAAQLGVALVSLEELFARADVVSLHTPWLPETVGLITGTHLASMKPHATFINTARGAIVREDEMADVLRQRSDLWAVLDVVYPEPPAADNPLLTLPNVVLTPHIAGSMNAECRRMGQYVIADLRRYLAGEPLHWSITREKAALLA